MARRLPKLLSDFCTADFQVQCQQLLPTHDHWNHRITVSLTMILPLPKGEGRGEGERMPPVANLYLVTTMPVENLLALGFPTRRPAKLAPAQPYQQHWVARATPEPSDFRLDFWPGWYTVRR
jgi:hypothetical protein